MLFQAIKLQRCSLNLRELIISSRIQGTGRFGGASGVLEKLMGALKEAKQLRHLKLEDLPIQSGWLTKMAAAVPELESLWIAEKP